MHNRHSLVSCGLFGSQRTHTPSVHAYRRQSSLLLWRVSVPRGATPNSHALSATPRPALRPQSVLLIELVAVLAMRLVHVGVDNRILHILMCQLAHPLEMRRVVATPVRAAMMDDHVLARRTVPLLPDEPMQ